MCLLGKVKGLRLKSRTTRCRDQFQAQRYQEPKGEENRLDRVCEFAEEGEQSCLYEVRMYNASNEAGQALKSSLVRIRSTYLLVGHLCPGERWNDTPSSL